MELIMDAINRLLAIEAIKQVKSRYMRAIDQKDTALLESTLTVDCQLNYGDDGRAWDNRQAFIDEQKQGVAANNDVLMMHLLGAPDIEMTSDATAIGRWPVYIEVLFAGADEILRMYAGYKDSYRLENTSWQICASDYKLIFRDQCVRGIDSSVLAAGSLLSSSGLKC